LSRASRTSPSGHRHRGPAGLRQANQIGLTVVGPEAPLVKGVVDAFRAAGLTIFGPTAAAAQLEGSKAFAKDFLARHNIPTADYQNFTEVEPRWPTCARRAPHRHQGRRPGRRQGRDRRHDPRRGRSGGRDMLSGNAFGDAGARVVIEEFLDGEEASFIVMVDGEHVLPMATSQDHKRVGDGDTGPNTGGMGAYSPAPVVTAEVHQRVMERVIMPTVRGMAAEGNVYTGFLYAGLMIDAEGNPKVIEFNCRFGDPETQPIMLRMRPIWWISASPPAPASWIRSKPSMTPRRHRRGAGGGWLPRRLPSNHPISGLPVDEVAGEKVFHAGTRWKDTPA
jgi:phosphoribosylamine--glycine ligase